VTPERVAGAGALGRERQELRGHAVLILGLLGQDRASDRYWDGALADERDRHRMGAHAVARDAAGGVGGTEEGRGEQTMKRSSSWRHPEHPIDTRSTTGELFQCE